MAKVERRAARRGRTDAPDGPPASRAAPDSLVRGSLRSAREAIRSSFDIKGMSKTPYGVLPLLLLPLLGIFLAFDGAAFSVVVPDIIRDREYNVASVISALNWAGFLLIFFQLAAGFWLDRWNRVRWVGINGIIAGAFSFLTARTNSVATLGGSRVVNAAGDISVGVPQFSLMADYYPPEYRGRAIAFRANLARAATLGAPLVIGYIVVRTTTDPDHPNWRLPFMVIGPAIILASIIVMLFLKEPIRGYMERRHLGATEEDARRAEERPSFGEAWRMTWSIRTFRRLFIASAVAGIGDNIRGLLTPLFFFERYAFSPLQRGAFLAITGVGALVGGLFAGGAIDSISVRRPQRVLVFVGILGVLGALFDFAIPFGPPVAVLVIVSILFGFFGAVVGPALFAIYAQIIPAHVRTSGLAMLALSAVPGAIVYELVISPLVSRYGFRGGLFGAAPFGLVGALIALSAAELYESDLRSAEASQLATLTADRSKREGTAKLLVCRGVDVAYDGVQVLFDVDFDVDEGEIVALLGTNGAGKSTLLKAIAGINVATSGGIVYDGREVTYMPPHEIARRGVILMPGGRGIFPDLTVRENLMLGNWLTEAPNELARLSEVYEIFPILKERLGERAGNLSGGEQQMLSMAQAFLANPKLLLIDELSLGLAPATVRELVDKVREIHRRGVTVVVVEQSVNVALTLAQRAVFMEKGEVRFTGPTEELLRRPDILRAVYVKGTASMGGGPVRAAAGRRAALEEARPVLEVEGVSKAFGGIRAVVDVSFVLRDGEALGLIGPNGAGKTTLFDLVAGYQRPDRGTIVFDGVDVTGLGPDERARRRLVRRFQDARLFPSLTVYENVLVALEHQLEVKSVVLNALQLPQVRRVERRARTRADRLIDLLDLGAYRDKFVKELSTGLRRITDLACVLASEPKVLLLDEPSTGIAQAEAEQLAPLLRRVRVESGCSMLIIEHDMSLISSISDELLAMDQGHTVVRDVPDVVLDDPRVVESYLGTSEEIIRRTGARG